VRASGLLFFAWMALGCASVSPRFTQDVSASFARTSMRHLETEHLNLYYPAERQEAALRLAERLEDCVASLKERGAVATGRKSFVVLTPSNVNNAYVSPAINGREQHMLLPENTTLELFNWFDLGVAGIGNVSCHEAVHDVQLAQTEDFWAIVNVVGGNIASPNAFLEPWFLEGLATYYESRLGRTAGRPNSPLWRGMFEALLDAHSGELAPGLLSGANREVVPFGGPYLVGQRFVAFLAERYGEDKLWELVRLQGSSWLPPLNVSLRFHAVYGKTLTGLFDDFNDDLRAHWHRRERPDGQRVLLENVGYLARLASAKDGSLAVVSTDRDEGLRLLLLNPDGTLRVERRLALLFPGRQWIQTGPSVISGMTFSADGRWLFWVSNDLDSNGADTPKLWKLDAHSGEVVQQWEELRGLGGSLEPGGRGYAYVEIEADVSRLMSLELATGAKRMIQAFEPGVTVSPPMYSPDGNTLLFSLRTERGFDLAVWTKDRGTELLTKDGRFNTSARWVDADRFVFVREQEGRAQAHEFAMGSRQWTPLTDAPHLVMDPVPLPGERIAFLSRAGVNFSLDVVKRLADSGGAASKAVASANADAATANRSAALSATTPDSSEPRANPPAPPAANSSASSHLSTATVDTSGAQPHLAAPPTADPSASSHLSAAAPAALPADDSSTSLRLSAAAGETSGAQPEPVAPPAAGSSPSPAPPASLRDPSGPQATPAAPPSAESTLGRRPTVSDSPASEAGAVPQERVAASPAPSLKVLLDEPYRGWDGLLAPELHAPYYLPMVSRRSALSGDPLPNYDEYVAGLSLQSTDRLGKHTLALNYEHGSEFDSNEVGLGYGNMQAAPWFLFAGGSYRHTRVDRDWVARASASRYFWTTGMTLGFEARDRTHFLASGSGLHVRLVGPTIGLDYFASDSTLHAGPRRAFGFSLSAAGYAGALTSSADLADLRAQVTVFLPLPLSLRHTFQLTGTGRYIAGAPPGLLSVGGLSRGMFERRLNASPVRFGTGYFLPPGVGFAEYLRGYEDFPIPGTSAAILDARYRFPLLIDRGWTSLLWVFPSPFIRQIDLEAFGSLARVESGLGVLHRSAGVAAFLRAGVGGLPLTLFYQAAYRFDDHLSVLHILGLSLE
jgi:hypothetical protein